MSNPAPTTQTVRSADLQFDPALMNRYNHSQVTPEAFQALLQLAADAHRRTQQRQLVEQFYADPQRQGEINKLVQPSEDAGYFALEQSLKERARQEAFQRARTGNIGGSVDASQNAQLQTQGQQQGAQLAAGFSGRRDALAQALEASRVNDVLGTYQIDPLTGQAIQQRANTINGQAGTNQNLFQIQNDQRTLSNWSNDELSRGLGNALNAANDQYGIWQNGAMQREQNAALDRRAQELL